MQILLQDLITIFLGILVEALPFVVLGVCISVLVDLYISPEVIQKYIPKHPLLSHLTVSLLGMFLPVCECGNVPLARRLLMQGFSVSQTVTFLLAAPIINPITLWSTLEAFNFAPQMAVVRLAAALVISLLTGMLIYYYPRQQSSWLVGDFDHQVEECEVDHTHSKLEHALHVFTTEFTSMLRLLMIGAFIAATTQTLIPRSAIESIGTSPVLSILAMLLLAFIVSICANIDAFFALAYVNTFTLGSLLTFLVFGPMVDIKILSMLRRTFSRQLMVLITIVAALGATITGLIFNLAY